MLRKISVVIFAILSLMALNKDVSAKIPQSERDALIAIYNNLGGPNWTHNDNWLGPEGMEGQWWGVVLNDDVTHVKMLSLSSNNLAGTMPPEVANFMELDWGFDFSNNHISGEIPKELFSLNKIVTINFSYNNLAGSIPKEIGNAKTLGKKGKKAKKGSSKKGVRLCFMHSISNPAPLTSCRRYFGGCPAILQRCFAKNRSRLQQPL
jgi:hypothetical protein